MEVTLRSIEDVTPYVSDKESALLLRAWFGQMRRVAEKVLA